METHVKVLGILNIVSGLFGLCGALVLVFVFGISVLGVSTDSDAALVVPIIGLTGAALVFFVVALSLPSLIVGYGLYTFRPWARVFGIVVSILALVMFPFGTALGIYGLWVLMSKDSVRLFSAAPASVGG